MLDTPPLSAQAQARQRLQWLLHPQPYQAIVLLAPFLPRIPARRMTPEDCRAFSVRIRGYRHPTLATKTGNEDAGARGRRLPCLRHTMSWNSGT
jgi:hypothetical protein